MCRLRRGLCCLKLRVSGNQLDLMGQVNAQSWESIESHYADLNEHGWGHDRLLALVQHIKPTEFSQRLFAVTSLADLIISNCNPFEFGHQTLRIEFDRASQLFIFRYCLQ